MDKQLRVLVIGAHPDDCEYKVGGLAAKFRRNGHKVTFVSMTNGDAGHHVMSSDSLAERRAAEMRQVAELTGIEYETLGIHDGRLEPDLATREKLIRLIRNSKPDLMISHRTNDYHPDHRATGILVMDASFLIQVPLICPDTPPLSTPPVVLYMQDNFNKPAPFQPDVIVAIDDVYDMKVRMLHCHESQFYEWLPYLDKCNAEVPQTNADRMEWLKGRIGQHDTSVARKYQEALANRYGSAADAIHYAEAFEIGEYGRPLPESEIEGYFPR